jgi:uncharacterized membrane protein YozB (DUF420 family)
MIFYGEIISPGATLFILVAAAIIGLAIQIALLIWVYKDAEKHGKQGALWLVIVLFSGCIGVVIYLIIRND